MRFLTLALGVILAATCVAVDNPSTNPKAELHDLVFRYSSAVDERGIRHPESVKLRAELESRIDEGERYDPHKLNARLAELYRTHESLLSSHTLDHPKTRANLRKLSLVSKLMTMNVDYVAEDLDRLADASR